MMVILLALLGMGAQSAQAVATSTDAPWALKLPPKTPTSMVPSLDRYRYFVDCIATSEWDVARDLLDTRIGSIDEARVLKRIGGGSKGSDCTYALQMKMTSMMMRGGIAEARYRFRTRNSPPPIGSSELASVPASASFKWVDFNKESAPARLWESSRCVANQEPFAVHSVFATRMGSKEEREAMQRLSRRFGVCLRPSEILHANMVTFRSWLGEAAYQHYREGVPDA